MTQAGRCDCAAVMGVEEMESDLLTNELITGGT